MYLLYTDVEGLIPVDKRIHLHRLNNLCQDLYQYLDSQFQMGISQELVLQLCISPQRDMHLLGN